MMEGYTVSVCDSVLVLCEECYQYVYLCAGLLVCVSL